MCSEPGLPDCLQLYSNRSTLLLPALSTLACYPPVQTQLFPLGIEGLFRCLITFLGLKASLQGPVLCQTCYNSCHYSNGCWRKRNTDCHPGHRKCWESSPEQVLLDRGRTRLRIDCRYISSVFFATFYIWQVLFSQKFARKWHFQGFLTIFWE